MIRLHTEIEIAAPAERVWRILTDFAAYPEWNPLLREVEGTPVRGTRLKVRIELPGSRGMTVRPKVLAADPPRHFRWHGQLLIPGLFDGEHDFRIETLRHDRVRFVQSESFRGLLVPLLRRTIAGATRAGFEGMNAALKERAEGG